MVADSFVGLSQEDHIPVDVRLPAGAVPANNNIVLRAGFFNGPERARMQFMNRLDVARRGHEVVNRVVQVSVNTGARMKRGNKYNAYSGGGELPQPDPDHLGPRRKYPARAVPPRTTPARENVIDRGPEDGDANLTFQLP